MTHIAQLKSKRTVAESTTAFYFSRPEGFTFKPGQAVDLILPDPKHPGAEGERHAFSLVGAPFQDELCITTRMRDTVYKRRLDALSLGASVQIDGPFGSLALHGRSARAAVFIAGGIGITPFMSMLRQAAHEALPHQILLLYSNRRPEDAAFLGELQELERKNARFRLMATMTQASKSAQAWTGEQAMVSGELIKREITGLADPIFYVVGPPAMVEALKGALNQAGIDEDDIRSEEFYGY
ncbi:FAD-dependent oxidoreductase [Pollutimonas sp. H1-120]|uniref:ferredoxin--NADP reductase n=1 Tax=Pollutimonas sp. H1-120 TaxID=3148824 RepID=UPI003B52BC3C